MAISVSSDRVNPEFTTLSEIVIERLGETPVLTMRFAETATQLKTSGLITAVEEGEVEGTMIVTVPSYASEIGMANKLAYVDKLHVGKVLSSSGSQIVVQTTRSEEELSDKQFSIPVYNAVGNPVQIAIKGGREWSLHMPMKGDTLVRAQQMVGGVFFAAVKSILPVLDITEIPSDLEIITAITALAQQQVSLDTFLTSVAEQLELDRRSGTYTAVKVSGVAPKGI